MFGLSLITLLFLVCMGLVVFVVMRLQTPTALDLQPRLGTVAGIVLVFTAVWFQPWIELDFLAYVDPTPDAVQEFIPGDLIPMLLEQFDGGKSMQILRIFGNMTSFNGWQVQMIPSLGGWTHLWLFFPSIPFVVALATLPLGLAYHGSSIARAAGGALASLASWSALALFMSLPDLDALGIYGSLQWNLLQALLGVRLGNGPWLCILGLLFLTIGGIVEMTDSRLPRSDDKVDSWEQTW